MYKIISSKEEQELKIPKMLKGKIQTFREHYKDIDADNFEAVGMIDLSEEVMEILQEPDTGNVLLKGLMGTGKTTLIQQVGSMIERGELPGYRLCVIRATDYVYNDGENTYIDKLNELQKFMAAHPKMVIVVDEAHRWGQKFAPMSIFDELKEFLTTSDSKFIFATTTEESGKYIEDLPALMDRRLKVVVVTERNRIETLNILKRMRDRFKNNLWLNKAYPYEDLPIKFSNKTLRLVYDLSKRHCRGSNPDLALRVMKKIITKVNIVKNSYKRKSAAYYRELTSSVNDMLDAVKERDELTFSETEPILLKIVEQILDLEQREAIDGKKREIVIDEDIVVDIVAEMAGKDREKVDVNVMERLALVETELKKDVVGADSQIESLMSVARRNAQGLADPNRPLFNGVYPGPTGVGKTYLPTKFAEKMGLPLYVIDCSKIQRSHEIANIVGSPPGYVGSQDGSVLQQWVKNNPTGVIIFDEIEKAHPDLFKNIMGIYERGVYETAKEGEVSYRQNWIFHTSNLGAEKVKRVDGVSAYIQSQKSIKAEEKQSRIRLEAVEKIRLLYDKTDNLCIEKQKEDESEQVFELREKRKWLLKLMNSNQIQSGQYPNIPLVMEVNIDRREDHPDQIIRIDMTDVKSIINEAIRQEGGTITKTEIIEIFKKDDDSWKQFFNNPDDYNLVFRSNVEEKIAKSKIEKTKETALLKRLSEIRLKNGGSKKNENDNKEEIEKKVNEIRNEFLSVLKTKHKEIYDELTNSDPDYEKNLISNGTYKTDALLEATIGTEAINLETSYIAREGDVTDILSSNLTPEQAKVKDILQKNQENILKAFREAEGVISGGGRMRVFPDELINRFKSGGGIQGFNHMSADMVVDTAKRVMDEHVIKPQRIFSNNDVIVKEEVYEYLAKFYTTKEGARGIRTLVNEEEIKPLISDAINRLCNSKDLNILIKMHEPGTENEKVLVVAEKKESKDLQIEYENPTRSQDILLHIGQQVKLRVDYFDADAKVTAHDVKKLMRKGLIVDLGKEQLINVDGSMRLSNLIPKAGPISPVAKTVTVLKKKFESLGFPKQFIDNIVSKEGSFIRTMIYLSQLISADQSIKDQGTDDMNYADLTADKKKSEFVDERDKEILKKVESTLKEKELEIKWEITDSEVRFRIEFENKFTMKSLDEVKYYKKLIERIKNGDDIDPRGETTDQLEKDLYVSETFISRLIELSDTSDMTFNPMIDFEINAEGASVLWGTFEVKADAAVQAQSDTTEFTPFSVDDNKELPDYSQFDDQNKKYMDEFVDRGLLSSCFEDSFSMIADITKKLIDKGDMDALHSLFITLHQNLDQFEDIISLDYKLTDYVRFMKLLNNPKLKLNIKADVVIFLNELEKMADDNPEEALAAKTAFEQSFAEEEKKEEEKQEQIQRNISKLNRILSQVQTEKTIEQVIPMDMARERIEGINQFLTDTNILDLINANKYLTMLIKNNSNSISIERNPKSYIIKINGGVEDSINIKREMVIESMSGIQTQLQEKLQSISSVDPSSEQFEALAVSIMNLLKESSNREAFFEIISTRANLVLGFQLLQLLVDKVFSGEATETKELKKPTFDFPNTSYQNKIDNWQGLLDEVDSNNRSSEGDVKFLDYFKEKLSYMIATGDRYLCEYLVGTLADIKMSSDVNTSFMKYILSEDLVNDYKLSHTVTKENLEEFISAIKANNKKEYIPTLLRMINRYFEDAGQSLVGVAETDLNIDEYSYFFNKILDKTDNELFNDAKAEIAETWTNFKEFVENRIQEMTAKTIETPERLAYFFSPQGRYSGRRVMVIADEVLGNGQAATIANTKKVADLLDRAIDADILSINNGRDNGKSIKYKQFMQKTNNGYGYYLTVEKEASDKTGKTKLRIEFTNGSSGESSWRRSYTGYIEE